MVEETKVKETKKITQQVVWDKAATEQLQEIYFHIKDNVDENTADKVIYSILNTTENLAEEPEIYSLDRFKSDNDDTYFAAEKHNYRISYQVLKFQIRILKIRYRSK